MSIRFRGQQAPSRDIVPPVDLKPVCRQQRHVQPGARQHPVHAQLDQDSPQCQRRYPWALGEAAAHNSAPGASAKVPTVWGEGVGPGEGPNETERGRRPEEDTCMAKWDHPVYPNKPGSSWRTPPVSGQGEATHSHIYTQTVNVFVLFPAHFKELCVHVSCPLLISDHEALNYKLGWRTLQMTMTFECKLIEFSIPFYRGLRETLISQRRIRQAHRQKANSFGLCLADTLKEGLRGFHSNRFKMGKCSLFPVSKLGLYFIVLMNLGQLAIRAAVPLLGGFRLSTTQFPTARISFHAFILYFWRV